MLNLIYIYNIIKNYKLYMISILSEEAITAEINQRLGPIVQSNEFLLLLNQMFGVL